MEQPTYEQLREYYDSTYGTWMIDRDPKEVDIDWIRQNAFQAELTDADKVCKDTSYTEGNNGFVSTPTRTENLIDSLNISNRENIRMKCMEAALKFYDLKSKETLNIGLTRPHFLTNEDIINLAEEFYKFVKGE